MGLGVFPAGTRSIPSQTAAMALPRPSLQSWKGSQGRRGGLPKILCRAGRGRIGGCQLRGGRCGWSVSARLGGRSDSTAPSTPTPGAHTIPSPPCRVPPGARLFRRIAASAPSGSSRPFPPGDRAASRRELRPLWLAGARPRPSRRAAALPPSSRPPAAGTRVAAYKRGGARASPPLPAAERTGRNGGR